MTLTGVIPTCEGPTYDYQCSNDGDRLSWRPHQLKSFNSNSEPSSTCSVHPMGQRPAQEPPFVGRLQCIIYPRFPAASLVALLPL